MPTKLTPRKTHPLIWLLAILCMVLAIAVIITGITIFSGYMIIRPKLPYIRTSYAHLDGLNYDQEGNMDTQVTVHITAVNDNNKVHATFTDFNLVLRFYGETIASLVAEPFDVEKNSTLTLAYVVKSSTIVLGRTGMEALDVSLKRNRIPFVLSGDVRTRWKVGIIGFVKFWTHLYCELEFSTNGTRVDSSHKHCNSRSD